VRTFEERRRYGGPVSTGCRVDEAREVSPELAMRLRELVAQLSSSATAPTDDELESIAASPATRLLVARDESGAVLGMLTLAVFRIPTGVRAWIEDVVVDEAARGRGVGRALTHRALDVARADGARTVELTSRPTRAAANGLYTRMGFAIRDTNVYRFTSTPMADLHRA
jgi:ribosomal protein S18 acetylase RimI-like enzyme